MHNREVASLVQEMVAENPNWYSLNGMRPISQQPSTILSTPPPPFSPRYISGPSSMPSNHYTQDFPLSWSQLLRGGIASEEEKDGCFQYTRLENWEDQILNQSLRVPVIDVKQEINQSSQLHSHVNDELQACPPCWSSKVIPISSPRSCITGSISSNILDFSTNSTEKRIHEDTDHSSQYNRTATSGASKKARVQPSSTQPPLKVRKEKLGDKITALHQIVSPFGKTDTASVLFEAIGYIRFLQGSIEALSSPYLGNVAASVRHQQSEVQDSPKDLRTRGLCLVPVSYTDHVNNGSDNGVDYWAPSLGGSF